jgi:HK97 family phage portal protein
MSILSTAFQKFTGVDVKALNREHNYSEFGTGNPTKRFTNQKAARHLKAYGGDADAIDWVMDCVRLIIETTSNAEYHFEQDGEILVPRPSAQNPDAKTAPDDLVSLLEEPNPYMDWVELIELLGIDILLAGEGFWLKHAITDNDRPLALYRLSPALIDVIPGETSFIDRYEYRAPGKVPISFKPDEIIHFKLPNPHDQYRGLGIIAGGPRVFDTELSLVESEAQFFEQGTKLSGVLTTDKRVPEPMFKKIQSQFRSMYSGARNAYKVAVLEQGLKFSPIQPSAADAQYVELSKLSRDRIAHMFRVPLPLLGNMENANYKLTEAQRVFDTKTMRPFLNKLEKAITRGLTSLWDVEFKIDYEYVMPEEDRLNLVSSFSALPGVTVGECRQQAGLSPFGDERDNIVLNLTQDGAPNRNLPGEGGRPPNGENVPSLKPGEQTDELPVED